VHEDHAEHEMDITQVADETDNTKQHETMPEDLRASELRYRRLFESARDGILILDVGSRRITDVNPFMVELTGYPRDEFLGKELWQIGLFKHRDESRAAFRELQEKGYIRYEDLPLQTKTGKQWNVEFVSNVYTEDNRQVIQCNIRDITGRKRAEAALRDAQERLSQAMNAANMFSWEMNPKTQEFSFSSNLERTMGFTFPKEIINNPLENHLHPEDAERAVRKTLRAIETGEPYEDTMRMINPHTGEIVWMHSQGVVARNAEGVERFVGIAQNITERKRAEEALRVSEMRFRAMFEQANVGIVQASFDGTLLKVNPGFCKIVGYTEGELDGMAIRDLTHPNDYQEEETLTRRLMAGEIPGYSIEKRYLRKDGRLVWGQMTATRVSQSSGEPFYMLAIVEDISERKWAEDALVRLNEQLEQRVAERTVELMGTNDSLQAEIAERRKAERERASILRRLVMAQEEERRRIARDMHDQFGQQLTVLILKLGMLKEDCGGQRELREQVENLEEVAGRLDADVDFLVWQLRPTALDDLGLQDALAKFAQNWSKHFGIPVEVLTRGLGKEASTSEIDTTLYRIAQEALNNAAKHSRAASVTILLEGRADAVSLIIEDDGVGFNVESVSGANDKGLGLVGMRERAALVGGTAEVESQPGEGTRVIVRIPTPPPAQKGKAHE